MKQISAQELRAITIRRRLSAFCVMAGLLAMATVVASQIYAHLVPCALCLWERWPYRVLIALGMVGTMLPRSFGRVAIGLAVPVMVAGIGLAILHLGVEYHLWKSPIPACQALLPALGQSLPDMPAPPCDSPAYIWPRLPISMAAFNLLYQLSIVATLMSFFPRTKRETANVRKKKSSAGRPDKAPTPGADDPG